MSEATREFDNFMSKLFGPKPPMCDCPPGTCNGGGGDDGMDALHSMLLGMGASMVVVDPLSDHIDDEADEDMIDLPDTFAAELADREAVHQLGRILEGLTAATQLHAQLVSDVVGG